MTKNLNLRKVFFLALLMLCANLFAAGNGYTPQKREFRGAWIQCVNGQFIGMSTQKMQQTLAYQLDELQKDGVNAISSRCVPSATLSIRAILSRGAVSLPVCKARRRSLIGTRCSG